jgi:hypothetical protein
MHKKLGPLEAWQWAAMLAGLVVVYYVYEKQKNSAASSASAVPAGSSTDTSGAIDPTTGLPYASEIGTGAGISGGGGSSGTGGISDGGLTLQQELSDLGNIEQLMSGLGLGTGGSTTSTTVTGGLSAAQTKTLNKQLTNINKTLTKLAPTRKKTTKPGNHKNPGHRVTTHPGGKKTAASTAPHNGRQHTNVQPPNHQRANPKPKPRPTRSGGHR